MLFIKISAKNDKFGYPNSILGKLGVTHVLGWWLVGNPCRLSIRFNWTFSAIYYGSGPMRRNVYSSAVFADFVQILLGYGRSHQPFFTPEN